MLSTDWVSLFLLSPPPTQSTMLLTRLAQVARQTPTVLRSSATLQHRASSGGQHYNAPSGYLFGEKVSHSLTRGAIEGMRWPGVGSGRGAWGRERRVDTQHLLHSLRVHDETQLARPLLPPQSLHTFRTSLTISSPPSCPASCSRYIHPFLTHLPSSRRLTPIVLQVRSA